MTHTILIFGRNGQVGFELTRSLSVLGKIVAMGRHECDMSDELQIEKVVLAVRPDVIVNAAAYTAVDQAEQEVHQAELINSRAAGTLAWLAHASSALLVHYSTDYVYSGDKQEAYVESDVPNPRSAYGRSKLAGEELIRLQCPSHFIFRTSWVFGAFGSNFMKTMVRLIRERDALRVVADQHGAPTSAALIADVTAHVVAAYLKSPSFETQKFGTYHLVAEGSTTWHGYATMIAQTVRELGLTTTIEPGAIAAISTDEYPLPAPRPANSRLDSSKLKHAFGLELPQWEDDLHRVLRQVLGQ